jgi:hypothetical protein
VQNALNPHALLWHRVAWAKTAELERLEDMLRQLRWLPSNFRRGPARQPLNARQLPRLAAMKEAELNCVSILDAAV